MAKTTAIELPTTLLLCFVVVLLKVGHILSFSVWLASSFLCYCFYYKFAARTDFGIIMCTIIQGFIVLNCVQRIVVAEPQQWFAKLLHPVYFNFLDLLSTLFLSESKHLLSFSDSSSLWGVDWAPQKQEPSSGDLFQKWFMWMDHDNALVFSDDDIIKLNEAGIILRFMIGDWWAGFNIL